VPSEPAGGAGEKSEAPSLPAPQGPELEGAGPPPPENASPPPPENAGSKEPEKAGTNGEQPVPANPPGGEPKPAAPAEKEPVSAGPGGEKSEPGESEKENTPPPWQAKDGDGIWFNFKKASFDTVLTHLSEVTGLVVVRANGGLEGTITVESRQRLSVDEAISVLNSVLKEKGFAGIRVGRTLKIVKLDQAVKSNIPVHVGSDPEKIAESDEIITQILPLKRVEARQLLQDLRDLFSEEASISSNQNANALIITDASVNIRRIAKVIAALDLSDPTMAKVEVYPLKYADATEAARLITEIFQNQGGRSSRSGSRRDRMFSFFSRMRGGGRGGGGPGGFGDRGGDRGGGDRGGSGGVTGSSALEQIPVTASADTRTNNVVVSGPPEVLEVVKDVLEQLDSNPASQQDVFVYRVKYGQALQIEGVVNTLFGTGGSSRMGGTSRGTTRGVSSRTSSSRGGRGGSSGIGGSSSLRSSGLADSSSRFGGSGGGMGGSSRGGSSGRGGFGGGSSSRFGGMASMFRGGGGGRLTSQSLQSAADLYGQVYAVADEDTNSLLVMTASTAFDIVRSIIMELDTPVPQVLIKVLIAEVTHTDSIDLGVEGTILNIPQGSNLWTDFSVAAQTGGLIYKLLETDIEATIRLLAEHSKLEVLSRPYILASDNQEATIMIGQEVPFIRNTRITQNDATINTIEYEDIGIILVVTPHTNKEGIVTLDVAPEISAISGETVPISETASAPVIVKRSASTRAAIADGQTIIIGGLMEDQLTEDVSKVPLLGDIPVIGNLFRRKQKKKSKTELLLFLTPQVAQNPYALKRMTKDEKEGIEILPDAVEKGTFEKQLKGMERGKSPDADARNERYEKELLELEKALEEARNKKREEEIKSVESLNEKSNAEEFRPPERGERGRGDRGRGERGRGGPRGGDRSRS